MVGQISLWRYWLGDEAASAHEFIETWISRELEVHLLFVFFMPGSRLLVLSVHYVFVTVSTWSMYWEVKLYVLWRTWFTILCSRNRLKIWLNQFFNMHVIGISWSSNDLCFADSVTKKIMNVLSCMSPLWICAWRLLYASFLSIG